MDKNSLNAESWHLEGVLMLKTNPAFGGPSCSKVLKRSAPNWISPKSSNGCQPILSIHKSIPSPNVGPPTVHKYSTKCAFTFDLKPFSLPFPFNIGTVTWTHHGSSRKVKVRLSWGYRGRVNLRNPPPVLMKSKQDRLGASYSLCFDLRHCFWAPGPNKSVTVTSQTWSRI